jgi:hypothetical protein
VDNFPTIQQQMNDFSDCEVLIAAGLLSSDKRRNDGFFIRWVNYAKELRRRNLTWAQARAKAREFVDRTGYPKRGWEAKADAMLAARERKGKSP